MIETLDQAAGRPDTRPRFLSALSAEALRQFICGLHGHEVLLKFEREHICLRCVMCGYQSSGWDVRIAAHAKREQREH